MVKNIVIVGVGGQGTLLASRVLGHVTCAAGYDVKVSEVHGMSQRGGSVITYVRYGDQVHSPIVSEEKADIILAFEQMEALRWLGTLKKDGKIIVNTQKLDPMPVVTGAAEYPGDVMDRIRAGAKDVIALDALSLAEEAGSSKAVNIVLLGVLAKSSEIPKEAWLDAIRATVPPKFLDMNLVAFEKGYQIEKE